MAVFHKSTHALTGVRPTREDIDKMTAPYFAQIAENQIRAKTDSSFDAYAASVPLYRRILVILQDTYKRAFEFAAGPIKHAAQTNKDEILFREYEQTLAGFCAPT